MSNTARQFSAVRTRLNPLSTALERARLTVVPRGRTQAKRLPFVALVTAILLGGVIGLLMFNTSMQQAAFAEAKLDDQATSLDAREQGLQLQLNKMNDPQRIASRAQAQGMVIPGAPALLHVPSGKVTGTPAPATRDFTPPVWASNPAPHYTAPTTSTATPTAPATPAHGAAGAARKSTGTKVPATKRATGTKVTAGPRPVVLPHSPNRR
jgi:cell division protein FtsB